MKPFKHHIDTLVKILNPTGHQLAKYRSDEEKVRLRRALII